MFKQLLVPIDLSHKEHAKELFKVCSRLAEQDGATVNTLYVDQSLVHHSTYPHLNQDTYVQHSSDASKEMEQLMQELPEKLTGKTYCREGTVHDQILKIADELKIDAIVMMAKKPGITSYFIGSNSERVVRHAKCSVFVVRETNLSNQTI